MAPAKAESSPPSRVGRVKARVRVRADAGRDWVQDRRGSSPPIDLSIELYERDRDTFASMFGSAIALRLFLFMVPVMLIVVGLVGTVAGADGLNSLSDASGATGSVAAQLGRAARSAHSTGWALLAIGVVLTPWAARSLITVLSACARGAWRMGGRTTRTSLRSVAAVTALLALMVGVTFALNQIRSAEGVVLSAAGLVAAAVVVGVGWFAVTLVLPRATTDPGALLPGAVLVGAGLGALQWFIQFYLPDKIARSSAVMGTLGVSIALLGYMFLVGRLLAGSLVLDAVVFERFGSISGFVFSLPGLRRLPARSARFARFFDLDPPTSKRDPAAALTPEGSVANESADPAQIPSGSTRTTGRGSA